MGNSATTTALISHPTCFPCHDGMLLLMRKLQSGGGAKAENLKHSFVQIECHYAIQFVSKAHNTFCTIMRATDSVPNNKQFTSHNAGRLCCGQALLGRPPSSR
jgi:hypothetical protein